jgi:hypothetical protein
MASARLADSSGALLENANFCHQQVWLWFLALLSGVDGGGPGWMLLFRGRICGGCFGSSEAAGSSHSLVFVPFLTCPIYHNFNLDTSEYIYIYIYIPWLSNSAQLEAID